MTKEQLEARTSPIASFEIGTVRAPKGPYSCLRLAIEWQNGRKRKFSIFDENGEDKLTETALSWYIAGEGN